jgi:uncharacterized phage protein (TIGR02218 family)
MRTVPSALATALASTPRKGAECLVLEALDGDTAGFTTWDRALSIDVGRTFGAVTCSVGMNVAALTLATGLDTGSVEIDGPLTGAFSRVDILGGKWRSARAWLVWVSPGISGFVALMRGRVGEPRVEDGKFVLELRNAADAFNQSVGRVLSPYCTATFGDSTTGCPVVRTAYACAVTAVASAFQFTVNLVAAHPDQFFALGSATFLSGPLSGLEGDVFSYVGASAAVELIMPMVVAPAIGDTLNLFRGCSKLIVSESDPDLPTCLTYGAGESFRGWPDVPGNLQYLKVVAPGSTNA